jgi:hypothetical protein
MSVKDLMEALNGPNGTMDAYLEVMDEREIRADIRALMKPDNSQREHFAAMAMQGLLANAGVLSDPTKGKEYAAAVATMSALFADALLSELAKEPK